MFIKNIFKSFLRLKTWDFATMLKLRGMIGTWDPMWTGLKFSQLQRKNISNLMEKPFESLSIVKGLNSNIF